MAGNYITETMEILRDYCHKATPFWLDQNEIKEKAYCILLEGKYHDDCNYQDLTGFEVIYKLRQELRFKGSIVVLSFLERDNIKNINYNKQRYPERILDTSNIEFYNIDGSNQNKQEVKSKINKFIVPGDEIVISDFGLDDVLDYSLDYGYLFNDVMHDLKDFKTLENLENFIDLNKTKILSCVKNEYRSQANHYLENMLLNHPKVDFKTVRIYLEDFFLPKLKGNSKFKNLNGNFVMSERPEWEVVYVDDNPKARKKVEELFELRNIKCHSFSKCPTADEIDKIPNFGWFISDYRLKSGEKWHHRQGFDLINYFMEYYDTNKVFTVFTSKDTIILKGARESSKEINWYSKDLILKDSVFFDSVLQANIFRIEHNYKFNKPLPYSWKREDVPLNGYETFKNLYDRFKSEITRSKTWQKFNQDLFDSVSVVIETEDYDDCLRHYKSLRLFPQKVWDVSDFISVFETRIKIRRIVIAVFAKHKKSIFLDISKARRIEQKRQYRSTSSLCVGLNHDALWNDSVKKLNEVELTVDDLDFLKKADLSI